MPRSLPALPHPSSPITDSTDRVTREWYDKLDELVKALLNRVPVTGTLSFAAATTTTVTFGTPESDANYDVWFAAPDGKTYWASSKTVNGFTANASSSVTATVRWQLIRA